MVLNDSAEYEQLATLIKGFGNDTRLALLLGLYAGDSASEIATFMDITRGGMQNNINKMADADLLYRPSADDAPTYRLTPIGQLFAQFIEAYGSILLAVLSDLDDTREQIAHEVNESPVAESLGTRETEKLIHTRSWEQMEDEITARLTASRATGTSPETPTPHRGFAFESSLSTDEIGDILDEHTDEQDTE